MVFSTHEGKEVRSDGVILSSSSAPQEMHFSFESYTVSQGAYVLLMPIQFWGHRISSHPNQRLAE